MIEAMNIHQTIQLCNCVMPFYKFTDVDYWDIVIRNVLVSRHGA